MIFMFEFIFWIIFSLILTHYFFFNLIMILFSRLFKINHKIDNQLPSISFIIAAYNEEKIIREKILNDLDLDYPKEKLEIIIVSDGSSDNTPKIVNEYQDAGIISLHKSERQGKTAALNRAIEQAKNEIIVFSDANSMFKKDALKKLVRHFADENIGGVCGRKAVKLNQDRAASTGDNLYWNIESIIKQAESNLGSIPTADGEIFAMRRELYQPIPNFIINDDMAITFSIITQGKRVIYDIEAITEEDASINLKDDYNVKARMVYGSLQILEHYFQELNPLNSWFGFQFFFHKTLRYFMWLLLLSIYFTNLLIIGKNSFYSVFFILQNLFYLFSLIGYLLNKSNINFKLFYIPYYYCNVNLAAYHGYCFYREKQNTVNIWKKAAR